MSLKTRLVRIGVKDIPDGEIGSLDFFEISALDERLVSRVRRRAMLKRLSSHQELVLLAGLYFFRGNRLELEDKARILGERCESVGSNRCVFQVPTSLLNASRTIEAMESVSRLISGEFKVQVHWDFKMNRGFKVENRVLDPMWEKVQDHTHSYWRIHGWHSERWIRLYSTEKLNQLMKMMQRFEPTHLSFAHSQRFLQVNQFITASLQI